MAAQIAPVLHLQVLPVHDHLAVGIKEQSPVVVRHSRTPLEGTGLAIPQCKGWDIIKIQACLIAKIPDVSLLLCKRKERTKNQAV